MVRGTALKSCQDPSRESRPVPAMGSGCFPLPERIPLMQQVHTGRRRFLAAAGSAIAMPYVITSSALGAGGRGPASGRIVMATIGCGGQGTGDMRDFLGFSQVQMVAVCDVVAGHREHA